MRGYVIQSTMGSFLTQQCGWVRWDGPEKAYVHSLEQIGEIAEMSRGWEIKPVSAHPARFENGVVTIIGTEVRFESLFVRR